MENRSTFLSALLFILSGGFITAKSVAQTLQFTPLSPSGTALSSPLDIVASPDASGRMFIVQKAGTIRIFNAGSNSIAATPFLNISGIVNAAGEGGLLTLAFHPAYASNGYFFVVYVNAGGSLVLARYSVDAVLPNQANPASAAVLMTIPHPGQTNHYGGKLNFGPDGNLYWSTGDGGSGDDPPNNSQNGAVLLGKMLRINVDNFTTPPFYTIPGSNPYTADPAVADEVWSLGLRNPFRWSFDRLTGDMWIGDVGQNAWEEVDFAPAGSTGGINWGWRCREGLHPNNAVTTVGCPLSYTDPVFEYGHNGATGGFSITGGYVYRGSLYPTIYGKYITTDYVTGNTFLLTPAAPGAFTSSIQTGPGQIAAFGENVSGELYAVGLNGVVYSVGAAIPLPVEWISFTHARAGSCERLSWVVGERGTSHYDVEKSGDGQAFQNIGAVKAAGISGRSNYSFDVCGMAGNTGYYRIKRTEQDGRFSYSGTLRVDADAEYAVGVRIYPTIVRDGQLHISSAGIRAWSCIDATGKKVYQSTASADAGIHTLFVPSLSAGVYYAHFRLSDGRQQTQYFIVE